MPRTRSRIMTVEAALRDAARTLQCGPLPTPMRTAIPAPVGRRGIVCPIRLAPKALARLAEMLAMIRSAGLTDLQGDLIWYRAFGLSWKEIETIIPAVSRPTLERQHIDALRAIVPYGLVTKRKTLRDHESAKPNRRAS